MRTPSLADAWPTIRDLIERAQRSSLYCTLATVGADGMPTVTPIGTVFACAISGSLPSGLWPTR